RSTAITSYGSKTSLALRRRKSRRWQGNAPLLTLGPAAQIQSEMNHMNIELKGRKAIVTGSTAGIGRATAEGLARAGASVVINGRGGARVDEAVRQMRQAFPGSDIS